MGIFPDRHTLPDREKSRMFDLCQNWRESRLIEHVDFTP
jgi:hypothetical protein